MNLSEPLTAVQFEQITGGIANIVGTIAIVVAGIWAVTTFFKSHRLEERRRWDDLEQRKREFAWNREKLAKEINDEWRNHARVTPILRLVDIDDTAEKFTGIEQVGNQWVTHEFNLAADEDVIAMQLNPATRPTDEKWEARRAYLRRCFDTWFYYLGLLEHYEKTVKLVDAKSIDFPASYYEDVFANHPANRTLFNACIAYMEHYKLNAAAVKRLKNRVNPDKK